MLRSAFAAACLAVLSGCGAIGAGAHPDLPPFVERPNGALNVLYQRPVLAQSRLSGEPYERSGSVGS